MRLRLATLIGFFVAHAINVLTKLNLLYGTQAFLCRLHLEHFKILASKLPYLFVLVIQPWCQFFNLSLICFRKSKFTCHNTCVLKSYSDGSQKIILFG